jgi:hypothetical protein
MLSWWKLGCHLYKKKLQCIGIDMMNYDSSYGRSSPPKLPGPEGNNLQLHFRTRMPPHLFTGGKVEGEQGAAIHVVLLDASTGTVVQTGP